MEFLSLDHATVLSKLPDRRMDAHKGDFGRVLLICGSKGYTGAAALSALGALRSGAGLVYLAVPESIYAIEAIKLLEPIIMPLPDQNGMLSEEAIKPIHELLPKMDAVLVGPGLSQCAGVRAVVVHVLKNFSGPVVLDADGINVLQSHKDILRGRTGITILTPHEGEFVRLFGKAITDRVENAALLAAECGVIVVLKGYHTVVTDANKCYINHTGNPGMAVGGSGDVLAGILVSLLGQGIPHFDAAACAVWLHGAAGDVCAKEVGQYGLLPSDLIHVVPRLMK